MQINTVGKITAYSNRQAFTNPSTNSGQDFLSTVLRLSGQIQEAESFDTAKSETPSISELTPQQLFERQKKIQEAPKYMVDGFLCSDYYFLCEKHISREKTINWQATGTDVLTQQQMEELQEKYDIENLSDQDYYDLMSDLTHLNVISGGDVARTYWKKGAEMNAPAELYADYNKAYDEFAFFRSSHFNFLKYLQIEWEHSSKVLGWLDSRIFDDCNPDMPPLEKQNYSNYLSAHIATCQKLSGIFESIKR